MSADTRAKIKQKGIIDAAQQIHPDFHPAGTPIFTPKGAACEVDGKAGKVWGGNSSANFNVNFDGTILNCHPYWRMKIFNDDGSVLYESEET